MAVIEHEERASISSDLFVMETPTPSVPTSAGDTPQPEHLGRGDAELVEAMLAHTRPVASDRFVD
jgi:hypothetical protein